MSIELVSTYPPQPITERARRTCISTDKNSRKIAYPCGKLVIVRQVDDPLTACLVYTENLSSVSVVEFSPCGRFLACGDINGQTRVFNVEGDETHTMGPFHAVAGKLNGIAFCPESSRLIAVGQGKDRMGHAFMSDTGNAIGEISGHSSEINAVAMKPNRPMRAVTVGDDGNIVFHEGPPFKFTRSIQKHTNAISDVDYSPNGEYFVTGGCDRQVGLFNGLDGEFIKWIETLHDGMVLSTSFLNDKFVLSSSTDCTIRISDLDSGKLVETYSLERKVDNQVTAVRSMGESEFVSVTLNGDIQVWKRGIERPVNVLMGHQSSVTSMNLNISGGSSGGNLVSGSMDGTVVQWTDKAVKLDSNKHEGPVSAITQNFSVGWDQKATNLTSGNVEKTEHQLVAAAEHQNKLAGVSEQYLELVGEKSVKINDKGSAIHMNDDLVVIGSGLNAQVYSLETLELKHEFPARLADVSAVQISPNNELLAVGDASGKITLYSLKDYSMITSRWAFHTSRVTAIKFSDDSLHCLTGSLDTNVYIYSVKRPAKNVKVLGAHKDGVLNVCWESKSAVYSAGSDGLIKKWNVKY